MSDKWRVGTKVPINVYEGDRPICQCQTAQDAQRIVQAMNATAPSPTSPDKACPVCGAYGDSEAVDHDARLKQPG